MSDNHRYIAEMLRISARAYAADAAERLLERHPECASGLGDRAFGEWQDHLAQRLHELAIAIELEEPSLFAAQLEWSREAFAAHEVSPEQLQHSLDSLRATLAEDLPEGAGEPAVGTIDQALSELQAAAAGPHRLGPTSDESRLALRYLEAVLSGERRRALRIVLEAVEAGLGLDDAYEKVLLPAQAEIGTMWHLGEIGVSEEHAATETTRMVMSVLSCRAPAEAEDSLVVLVAAVEGDRHDIGVRAVADLVEFAGFRAILLGADVPVDDLAQAVDSYAPDVVILSAALSPHLGALRASIGAIRETGNGADVGIIVGGPAFADSGRVAARLDADAYAASPSEAARLVGRLAVVE